MGTGFCIGFFASFEKETQTQVPVLYVSGHHQRKKMVPRTHIIYNVREGRRHQADNTTSQNK